jgi:hypothetical protein
VKHCGSAACRYHQENNAGNLQPKLVQHLTEGSSRSRNRSRHCSYRAAALYLLAGNARHHPELLCGGYLTHGSILTAYGATMTQTCVAAKPFHGGKHLRWQAHLSQGTRRSGELVDQQLKQLMKELGEAINESLSDSEQIAEVVSRIKEGGYDIFLVLEATIGVSKQGDKTSDKTSLVTTLSTNPEFKINDQDLKFLKSLRIKIEEEKEK